ncbi:MAG TPA: IclR family transcriptional regulator [Paraburkholderia sp.]|nr:IclR family transcriptional regulator [Paraburkholderia sp.]
MLLKSLGSALELLRYFTSRQPVWGVRELARECGAHHSVVHRILATFAADGYLVQDELGHYALGLRWFEMGEIVRQTVSPTEIVAPVLHRLKEMSGETVFLSVLDNREGLCLDIAHSDQQLRFSIEQGKRFPLHLGAHAKAMLAFMPEDERADIYAREAAMGGTADVAALEASLEQVRMNGWVQTWEEATPGVTGIAVPVWMKSRSRVAGSISVCGPRQRIDDSCVPRMLELLREAQRNIEGVVGLLR